MANEINHLETLKRSISGLCHENELLQLLLQENWPPSQRLSPQAVLGQARRASEAEFRSRSRSADTKLASILSVPLSCQEILEALTEWIEQSQTQTLARVEQARRTL